MMAPDWVLQHYASQPKNTGPWEYHFDVEEFIKERGERNRKMIEDTIKLFESKLPEWGLYRKLNMDAIMHNVVSGQPCCLEDDPSTRCSGCSYGND